MMSISREPRRVAEAPGLIDASDEDKQQPATGNDASPLAGKFPFQNDAHPHLVRSQLL